MQTLGYGKEECLEFFLNCVDQLLYWKKIQFSTAQNWKKNIRTIYRIVDENEVIQPWMKRYYCSECLEGGSQSWFKFCPNCGAKMDGCDGNSDME